MGLSHIAVQAQPAGRTGRLDPGGRHRIDHLRIPLGVGDRVFPPHTDLARGATGVWIRSLESEGSDPRPMQETVRDFDVLREGEPVCRTVFRFETGILFGPLQQCRVGISPILERVPHFSQAVGLQPGLLISPPQGGEFLAQAEATDAGPGTHPIVPPTAIGFLRAGQEVVPDKAAGSRRPCQLAGPWSWFRAAAVAAAARWGLPGLLCRGWRGMDVNSAARAQHACLQGSGRQVRAPIAFAIIPYI